VAEPNTPTSPPARAAPITADPLDILWHYANGEMPFWINGNDGPVGWVRGTHRGVQQLDKIEIPKSQRRYVFSPKFEVRYNQAFEEVVRECADLKREGKTFLTQDLIRGYVALNKLGFAHSYEAWCDGKLAGGGFGLQLGSLLTVDSLFHRVSNAAKAAYGQTLMRMRERGFRIMDTNVVSAHSVNYGEEWMRMWEYEVILRQALRESPALVEGRPYPGLPWQIRYRLPLARLMRKVTQRFRGAAAAV
jgi:leucyl/phenylalanyl-tRNA--protein transferase